ncbi:hypothetical protein CAPSP0001_0026 [Capnocytophaga sputigena ATCC 33612]|nr:hypothetical protein CAPSP0001_0026 [Capnocytophaga sputigena ATCC 33612]
MFSLQGTTNDLLLILQLSLSLSIISIESFLDLIRQYPKAQKHNKGTYIRIMMPAHFGK